MEAVSISKAYGELSDITTDDGISLKSSEAVKELTTEYRLAELADATGIDYLYNGQYGVETDANGLYYMRARYYDQDIKRFINRDVVSGDITNSQSLNRYCYVQGNPVSLTDPFGLCPDGNSRFKDFVKFLHDADWNAIGHAALDVAGIFWEGADVINAVWYAMEGNTEMAIASAIFAIPGLGIGVGNLMMKSEKLASAGKAVRSISKMTQSGMGIAAGINMAQIGFTNMLNSIEAGEFSAKDFATFVGGVAIAAISGKGLVSSGKDFASIFDDVGKTVKRNSYYNDDGTPIYPPKEGFDGKKRTKVLQPGELVDRYGYEGGKYVSPVGTPYSARALPKGTKENKPYHVYKILKPVKVKAGKIAPWFGEPGGGIQYKFKKPISKLIKKGIIKEIK